MIAAAVVVVSLILHESKIRHAVSEYFNTSFGAIESQPKTDE
jgi:hypothetical protein